MSMAESWRDQCRLAVLVAWRQARPWPRHFGFHALRIAFVLTLVVSGVLASTGQPDLSVDIGSSLFKGAAVGGALTIMAIGIYLGSQLVRRERQRGTLDLLLMTEISFGSWLTGELLAAFWSIQSILFSAIPLLMLILRYGGVGGVQVLLLFLFLELLAATCILLALAWELGIEIDLATTVFATHPLVGIASVILMLFALLVLFPVFPAICIADGTYPVYSVACMTGMAVLSAYLLRACIAAARTRLIEPELCAAGGQACPWSGQAMTRPSVSVTGHPFEWKDDEHARGRSPLFYVYISIAILSSILVIPSAIVMILLLVVDRHLTFADFRQWLHSGFALSILAAVFCAVNAPMAALWRGIGLAASELEAGTIDLIRLAAGGDAALMLAKTRAAVLPLLPMLVVPPAFIVINIAGVISDFERLSVGKGTVVTVGFLLLVAGCLCLGFFAGLYRNGFYLHAWVTAFSVAVVAGTAMSFVRGSGLSGLALSAAFLAGSAVLLRFRVRRL